MSPILQAVSFTLKKATKSRWSNGADVGALILLAASS